MNHTHHLQEERLFECYLALRNGERLDPPMAEHLSDCRVCAEHYDDLTRFMDTLSTETADATDAVFTPELLLRQRRQIIRRLEHMGHPARVIAFPGRAGDYPAGSSAPHSVRRWVAASVAAGLFIGLGTGIILDWEASRTTARRAMAAARQTGLTAPATGVEILRADSSEADEAFLSELELAGQRPRILELRAVDALTPHVREVSLR